MDAGLDQFAWPDLIKLDGAWPDVVPQRDAPWWDYGSPDTLPTGDTGPKPDGWPPHLGCQSHAECTDPSSPCCCPTPFLPQIWSCLPLCLNPICM
jgi:hypothetical protein